MIGLELVSRTATEAPVVPLAAFFASGGGQNVALAEGAGGAVTVWTEIGPHHAACLRFDTTDQATRWSWRETLLTELRNVYPVGDMVLSSGWSKQQSSGSGLAASYTGNRAISTSSLTATATVTVSRDAAYDLWINFTGRTNGGWCRIDIDGAQDLVNEIDDPASLGFKAFSTYSPTDLQRRQSVLVATGLTGSHVVTIRSGGARSPGGNAILIEAVATTATLADARILPPRWQAGKAYEMGDEVQHGGLFYSARGNGQSGTNGPTHTGGIGSDGALNWRVDNRPSYPRFVAADYPSEKEYAARFVIDGAVTELGGQTHGNEVLQSRVVMIDDVPWQPAIGGNGLTVGSEITIAEQLEWRGSGGVPLAACSFSRKISAGVVDHAVSVTGTGPDAQFEWLYIGMLPAVHWDGESSVQVVETVSAGSFQPVALAEYDGAAPDNLDFADTTRVGLSGNVLDTAFRYGLEAAGSAVSGNIIDRYHAFLRPNVGGTTAGGSLDWQMKAYITGATTGGVQLGAGDSLAFYSRHVMAVG